MVKHWEIEYLKCSFNYIDNAWMGKLWQISGRLPNIRQCFPIIQYFTLFGSLEGRHMHMHVHTYVCIYFLDKSKEADIL